MNINIYGGAGALPPSAQQLASFRAAGEQDPEAMNMIDPNLLLGVRVDVGVDDLVQLYVLFNELQASHDVLEGECLATGREL